MPGVLVDPVVRTGAGRAVVLQVMVTNPAHGPRSMAVTVLGVDPAWLPLPVRTPPLLPGESRLVELLLLPAVGTLPARYPLTVAVQALDPVDGTATSVTELSVLTLVVDAPSEIHLDVRPLDVTTTFGRRIDVVVTNDGDQPAEVVLELQAPTDAGMRLRDTPVVVEPRSSTEVSARVRRRPRLVGSRTRHAYAVTAHSAGAPQTVEGSVTLRPLLGGSLARGVAILTLVALWVVAAVVAIPRLADSSRQNQTATAVSGTATPGGGGAGGSGAGGSGSGGAGSGGSAGGGAAGGAAGSAAGVRLNGTVSGADPEGVSVRLQPTSLVDESVQGATTVDATTRAAVAARGLAPAAAFAVVPAALWPRPGPRRHARTARGPSPP